jgi:ribosome maturation factor RimP
MIDKVGASAYYTSRICLIIGGSLESESLFYDNWKGMLGTGIKNTSLFAEYSPLLEALGITLVDINRIDRGFTVGVHITIMTKGREVDVSDCSKVYKLVYPRMELQLGERDLELEVSTPGLQRTIKDVYEFTLLEGKRVRVFDIEHSSWVSGLITESDDSSVTLSAAYIGDSQEMIETMVVPFARIQKAKLDYRWEDNSNGN